MLITLALLVSLSPVTTADFLSIMSNYGQIKGIAEEIKRVEDEKNRRITESNFWMHEEFESIVSEKKEDLRIINAILIRFKEDFRKIREEDTRAMISSQGVEFKISTQEKATEIFKTDIWKLKPQLRDLIKIVDHIKHEQHGDEIPKQEKIIHTKNKIDHLKKSLIYLRDLSIKKNITPHQIISDLAEIDFALMLHKHNKNWERYDYVMEILRNYDK